MLIPNMSMMLMSHTFPKFFFCILILNMYEDISRIISIIEI